MSGEHVCPWWLAYTFDNPLRRLVHNPAKMFGPYLGPGGKAADIGCGLGYFSLGLARLVGRGGRVYSLDLQERMLAAVKRRSCRAGLDGRIVTRQAQKDSLAAADLAGQLDLVLTFWMMHEVPDQGRLLHQVRELLRDGGHLFIAEPKMHVTSEEFEKTLALAQEQGLSLVARPAVAMSRAAVLVKGGDR